MRVLSIVAMIFLLAACQTAPIVIEKEYDLSQRMHLYEMDEWRFNGRLALSHESDSWSANIKWRHQFGIDHLSFSGPLGQGAVSIVLSESQISIDKGDGKMQSSRHPDELVNKLLGVFVPVRALRYWVLGLPRPSEDYRTVPQGFVQYTWRVSFVQWVQVGADLLPRKIVITDEKTKMKLIIDQWRTGVYE